MTVSAVSFLEVPKAQQKIIAADLYIKLFDVVRKDPDAAGHGPEGYYFAENFEYSGLEAAQTISEALHELGVAASTEPSAFTQEELEKNFGVRPLCM